MECRPVLDPFGLRIGAKGYVADEGLAPECAILAIEAEGVPGAEIEAMPGLWLGTFGTLSLPFRQPVFVGKFLDQVSDPIVERFGALPT